MAANTVGNTQDKFESSMQSMPFQVTCYLIAYQPPKLYHKRAAGVMPEAS